MIEIEFLPASYREQTARRRDIAWRLTVLMMFGGAIAASAGYQGWLGLSVSHQLATVAEPREQAERTQAEVSLVQQHLNVERTRAGLYAYLDHPWPRTQILHTVALHAPEGVRLSQLQFARQAIPKPPETNTAKAKPAAADPKEKPPTAPFQEELDALRARCDDFWLVVSVRGEAGKAEAIHSYLAQLSEEPLFLQVRLQSLLSDDPSRPTQFELQLVVHPGFGQRNGPSEPIAPLEVVPFEPPAAVEEEVSLLWEENS